MTSSWIEGLARLGYTAVGVVYIIVGLMAAAARFAGSGTPDKNDAFRFILDKPFGKFLLFIITIGLLGYALWRLISGIKDAEHRGNEAKGLALRAGSIIRGGFYTGIAFEVARVATRGGGGGSSDDSAEHWTARLMAAPFGRWLALAAGLTIVGVGVYQITKAWRAKLSKQLSLGSVEANIRKRLVGVSRFGLAARGVVFGVIGASIVSAARRYNPDAASGTQGALRTLSEPLNGALLVAVGIGLASYGVYALVNARYRRIDAG